MKPSLGHVDEIVEVKGICLARISCENLYPGGGGQPCDQPTIHQNGISFKILQTYEMDGKLFWVIPGDQLKLGDVEIFQDELFRLEVSQQHSAQHIFSGLAVQKYGWKSDGFTIFTQDSKIELIGADLDPSKYEWLEKQTNLVISQRIPIEIYEAHPGDTIRKADHPEHSRVVTIEGVDKCCCSGTHVSSTDQVGGFSILQFERKNKESVRVIFSAGLRLAKTVQKYIHQEKKLKNLLKGDIEERIEILLRENEESRENEKSLLLVIASLVPLDPIIFRMDHLPLSLDSLKYLSLAIQQRGISSSLISQEGYFVLSGPQSDKLFEELKSKGAKGGGKGVITGKITERC